MMNDIQYLVINYLYLLLVTSRSSRGTLIKSLNLFASNVLAIPLVE